MCFTGLLHSGVPSLLKFKGKLPFGCRGLLEFMERTNTVVIAQLRWDSHFHKKLVSVLCVMWKAWQVYGVWHSSINSKLDCELYCKYCYHFFFNCTSLNKVMCLKSWLLSETKRNDFPCTCLLNRANFVQQNRISFFFELWIRFVCLQWTTAANIRYLHDSKQVAEVTFWTSDLEEEEGT